MASRTVITADRCKRRARRVLALCAGTAFAAVAAVVPASSAAGGDRSGATAAGAPATACTQQTVKTGIVTATGCFVKHENGNGDPVYSTSQEMDLNGFTLKPTPEAPLDINASSGHVTTFGEEISFGAKPLEFHEAAFNFNAPSEGEIQFAEIANSELNAVDLGGFSPVDGNIPVSLVEGGGRIDPTIDITQVFKLIEKNLSTTVRIDVVPGKGAVFDGITFDFARVDLGPFTIKEAKGEFSEADKTWGGTIDVLLTPEAGAVVFGFEIRNGELDEITIGADNLNASIVDGVFLQKLVGALKFSNLEIAADLSTEVTAGPEIDIFGHDVAAVAVDGDLGFDTGSKNHPGYLKLAGNVQVVRIEVADVSFQVFFDGAVDFSASMGIGLPDFNQNPNQAFFIGGGLSGWIHGPRYNFDGYVEARVIGITIAKGEGVISDKGAATCGTFFNKPSGGGGFSWQTRKVVVFAPFFCYIGRYKDTQSASARVAATGSTPIHLGRGHSFLRIIGDGDVPAFRLDGPDGRVIEHPEGADSSFVPNSHLVLSNRDQNMAHIELPRPKGTWHLTQLDGTGIVRIQRARRLADPRVDAEVRGRGAKRTLVWDARDFPKQHLEFQEKLPGGTTHPIVRTGKASGRYSFKPLSGGHYGKRKLKVGVQQRFSQRDRMTPDTYRVRKPRRPGEPRRVRAKRRAFDSIVRWRHSKRARAYRVALIGQGGGFRLQRTVGRNRQRVVFDHSPSAGTMRVKVWALNRDGKRGRPGVARLRTTALLG